MSKDLILVQILQLGITLVWLDELCCMVFFILHIFLVLGSVCKLSVGDGWTQICVIKLLHVS